MITCQETSEKDLKGESMRTTLYIKDRLMVKVNTYRHAHQIDSKNESICRIIFEYLKEQKLIDKDADPKDYI